MTTVNREFREWEAFGKKTALRYVTSGVDLKDLEQEAMLALLEALPKYTEDLGVSKKVFLGRKIRDRLSSLYRKTLNLVQVEQFWVVSHISGDIDLDVKAETRERGEAVMRANPAQFASMKHVKVLVSIGPSLDAELDDAGVDDAGLSMHETVGQNPQQELSLLASEALSNERKNFKNEEVAKIFELRKEGRTWHQIAQITGKDFRTVHAAYSRAQKRLAKRAA